MEGDEMELLDSTGFTMETTLLGEQHGQADGNAQPGTQPQWIPGLVELEHGVARRSVPGQDSEYEEECARYDQVSEVAATGNGLKLDGLLGSWQQEGWLRDWRNEEGLTLYADAITDGYIDIVNVLLSYDIPLGDALIRAIDVESDDAVKAICRYIEEREDILEATLYGSSDNDDFHPAMTPLILAAQRNNFAVVKLLVELGAEITEPSMSQGGDVTLTQAISTLHIYRALSQPAYILATRTDIFGHAFEMSAKLKTLSHTWEDFGAEYQRMADGVEVFAADILGQSSSTEEILALFRYHNTDKYRHTDGKQHPLAKLFEAIQYQQKEFIAHPHSQKAIIVQFYRSLLDWNERGLLYQILLLLLVLLGYPIICLLYIFVPTKRVVNFARLPYIMMMMKAGSGFTFLVFTIAVPVLRHTHPSTEQILHTFILVWIIGLAWMHIKLVAKHGLPHYFADSTNIHELAIMGLYFTVYILQLIGESNISTDDHTNHAQHGANMGSLDVTEDRIASELNGLRGRLNDTTVDGVTRILVTALSGCQPLPSPGTGHSASDHHQLYLQETIRKSQYDPTVVAGALFGVTITVSVLRLMNLLLVSDSVGPLRISLGAMVSDIVKFLCIFMVIWFAFAIGLFQNFYSAGLSATQACIGKGSDPESCDLLVGYSTFMASMKDLYWSLYGLTGIDILVLPSKHSVAEGVGTFLYLGYLIVAVLVLLNALIGMLSNTYNHTEEHADTEWKFHRAAVWATYLRPVGTLPPPFNLIPSIKTLFRYYLCCVGTRRSVVSKKEVHFEKELEDYKRVLKLVSNRYIQANLSTESQNNEAARPRDLQGLRNDILAFKFNVQDRLANVTQTLDTTQGKTTGVHYKLNDLDPLRHRAIDLVDKSVDLSTNVVTLFDETGNLQHKQELEITERDQDASMLRETIAKLRSYIEELKQTHSAEVARRDHLEAEMSRSIQGLTEDNSALTDTVRALSDDKSQLMEEVGELQERILVLKEEASELGSTVNELRHDVQNITDRHAEEMVEKDRQQAQQDETILSLREENKSLSDTISTMSEENAALTKNLSDLGQEVDSLKQQPSSLKYAIAAHRVEIDKLTGSHSRDLTARDRKESKLNLTIHELQEANTALQDNVRLLEQEKTELEKQLGESKVSDMEAVIVKLQEDLATLTTSNAAEAAQRDTEDEKLRQTIRDLQDEKKRLTDTAQAHIVEKSELSKALKELDGESHKMKDTLTALQQEIKALQSSQSSESTLRDMKEKKLTDTICELDEENKELNDKICNFQKDNASLKREVKELLEDIATLERDLSTEKDNNTKLQVDMKQLQSDNETKLTKAEGEKAKLNHALGRLKQDNTRLTDTLQEMERDKGNLAKKVSELTERALTLERDITELNKTTAELRTQRENLKAGHSTEMTEKNRLMSELKDDIRRLREDKSSLVDTLSGLKKDKAELVKLVGELNEEFAKLQGQGSRPKQSQGSRPKQLPRQFSTAAEETKEDVPSGLFSRIVNILGGQSANDKEQGFGADESNSARDDKPTRRGNMESLID